MELKEWIKAARLHKGFTQEQLGVELDLTKGNISGWENGRHEPSYHQLLKIQHITGYPLPPGIDLVTQTPPPPEGNLAERLQAELDTDPYALIEDGLKALIIVGAAKDEVMERVRALAKQAADTQRAFEERLRQRDQRRPPKE